MQRLINNFCIIQVYFCFFLCIVQPQPRLFCYYLCSLSGWLLKLNQIKRAVEREKSTKRTCPSKNNNQLFANSCFYCARSRVEAGKEKYCKTKQIINKNCKNYAGNAIMSKIPKAALSLKQVNNKLQEKRPMLSGKLNSLLPTRSSCCARRCSSCTERYGAPHAWCRTSIVSVS